jgi:hypothetical protein
MPAIGADMIGAARPNISVSFVLSALGIRVPFPMLLPILFNGQTTDSPILHFDFIDDYKCGGGLFAQDFNQNSGRASDELGFLLPGRTLSGNLDVYVWHC